MAPSDFAKADLDEVVEKLTVEEVTQLIAGVGFWHTAAIPRLGVPAVKVSDGPNGIRGNHFVMGTPAKCLPSSTAMGATFDTELLEEVGLKLLAAESKLRAASIALAPTCNIQRNPLGGRSFESFAEDPLLSGLIAAAYVRGVQKGGIGVAIKHFVCNDKENDRMGYDSILSERALREIYLMPFMLAQRYAEPWSFMTSYNRVNGTHASENTYLIRDILRKEWGFQGMTMSDWFGVYSIDHSINAGLDLEMPGTNKWRTNDLVTRSIGSRKITQRTLKERARKVLELVQRCAREAPEILDGDGIERTRESDEDKALMRKVAADSIVLLKNEGGILPLQPSKLKKIAIVGGNAKAYVLSGGGSASLKPSYFTSPYDGIVSTLPADVEVTYSEGARAVMTMPSLDWDMFTADGKRGWMGTWHKHESEESMSIVEEPYATNLIDETRIFVSLSAPKGITRRWTLRLKGQLKPKTYACDFEFGMSVSGRAKLWVDDKLIIDNWTVQRRGEEFFGCASKEERGTVHIPANHSPSIYVEFCNVRGPAPADGDEDEAVMDANAGMRLGGAEVQDADERMESAVKLAKEADVVVAVVGLNADWETEGYDRKTLGLPGRTDELVRKVVEANPKTVVVTQSGSSITMPWATSVPAVVHAWYGGNATGEAIADVLFGKVNPSGKLSLTFPKREEDLPSYGHFHSEDGKVHYGEGIFVGYKHWLHRKIEPEFAFGHGLSYTTFSYSDLKVGKSTFAPSSSSPDIKTPISFTLTNTGSLPGSEATQLYISFPSTSDLTHPPLQLRAFKKVHNLGPGESKVVELELDKYAVSYWNERLERWTVEKGKFEVWVGASSANLGLEGVLEVEKAFEWNGL
ncbi:beta-glucosidase [Stereum hirsutum FP-91666 SS1]|uniref:beta-glucosidase n=1 Tax=Stereum hirsutum (strain FP-91666) TaxID=721885 RepID=UPI000440BA1E|nr:beta-glucosidase [Stereum hirsutum FP-91666 SS1]EIM87989.1 beta-glucosidase [Stereum hirsutum FP-91666 SS1]